MITTPTQAKKGVSRLKNIAYNATRRLGKLKTALRKTKTAEARKSLWDTELQKLEREINEATKTLNDINAWLASLIEPALADTKRFSEIIDNAQKRANELNQKEIPDAEITHSEADAAEAASLATGLLKWIDSQQNAAKKNWFDRNRNLIAAIGAGVAFSLGLFFQWHSLKTTLETTRHTAMISTARSMFDEFNSSPIYADIEKSIAYRVQLYKGITGANGGEFTWQEINSYLGFFEEIGFYYRVGAIDLEVIDVLFGGVIIEAYLYEDVRAYVEKMRTDGGQPSAFEEFQRVAEDLMRLPSREAHVKKYATGFTHW